MIKLNSMKKTLLSFLIVIAFGINAQTISTFTFNINGSPVPAGLVTALNNAAQRWSNYLTITEPIKVNIFLVNGSYYPFSGLTLANGRKNFSNAPFNNYIYTTALANQLAGTKLNLGEYDMDIYVNLYTSFYYGTGKPANNKMDFITFIMHEIGHGLGFYSDGYVNSTNVGSFGNIPPSALSPLTTSFPWHGQDSVPSIYDKYIIKESQNQLVGSAPDNTTMLGDSIKYTSNYFSGPTFANTSNGGLPIKLSGGTGAFTLGVDLLHLNASVCNSIMSYCWGLGDTVRRPAPWELGILKEMGWNMNPASGVNETATEGNLFTIYPNPSHDYIFFSSAIPNEKIKSIELKNILGEKVAALENNSASDVSELSKGIYFIVIETDDLQAVQKFIKE